MNSNHLNVRITTKLCNSANWVKLNLLGGENYFVRVQNATRNSWLDSGSEKRRSQAVVSGHVKQGGGSPDEARLEQTPYPFPTQLIWRYMGIK